MPVSGDTSDKCARCGSEFLPWAEVEFIFADPPRESLTPHGEFYTASNATLVVHKECKKGFKIGDRVTRIDGEDVGTIAGTGEGMLLVRFPGGSALVPDYELKRAEDA